VGGWQRRVAAAVQNEVAGKALFVLITADHLFGEGGLDGLLVAGEPAVLIDPAPDRPAWAEGTRVRVVDQAVVAFGKHLEEPAIDCGAFLLPPECSAVNTRRPAKATTLWPVP
jgi:choline kinase